MIGQTLSHFRISAKLGEGGMGEVYRAEDTRLGREVAIKVLPEAFTSDPERFARFEREAKVLASLNHPNIAGIHQIEEAEGKHLLVLELVEGEDLAERLARGAVSVDATLSFALQLAEGLEAAHAKGIVHRDLKPANIKITPDGQVKILDFGLAKATGPATEASPLTHSPTLTAQMTQAGVLLGTAAYMSPEQARGEEADPRTDIWAFGIVLFEMITGSKAFPGGNLTDLLAEIVKGGVDWSALPADTPRRLERLLRRCLVKDKTQRQQSIGDARISVQEILAGGPEAPTPETTSTRQQPRFLAAIAAIATVVSIWALSSRTGDPPVEPRRSLIQTEPQFSVYAPAISPDGRKGLYSTGDRMGMWEIDQFEHRFWEAEHGYPFFSPDSEHIAFGKDSELLRLNLATGETRLVTRMPGFLDGGIWSDDGMITFFGWGTQSVYRVPAAGGDLELIAGPLDGMRTIIGELPGDHGLLFLNYANGGLEVLVDGELVPVLPGEYISWATWSPTGHLLYHHPDEGLWAVPFSLEELKPTAGPIQIDPIGTWPSLSRNGRLSYKRGLDRAQFVLMNRDGDIVGQAGRGQFMLQDPAVSPDGRTVSGVSRDRGGFALWLHELGSDRARRVPLDLVPGLGSATWERDGRHLILSDEGTTLWRIDLEGQSPPEELARGHTPHIAAKGRHLVWTDAASTSDESGGVMLPTSRILYSDLTVDDEPRVFLEGDDLLWRPRLSPDETHLAYESNVSGHTEIYVRRFPSGEGPWQISTEGGTDPRWSASGNELFYLQHRNLMSAPIRTEGSFEAGEPERLFTLRSPSFYEYSVTDDGLFVTVHPGEDSSSIAVVDAWERLLAPE